MNTIVVGLISIANLTSLLISLHGNVAVKIFLKHTPAINNSADLDSFKKLVSKQMYMALIFIVFTGISMVFYMFFLFTGFFSGLQKIFFLIQYIIIFIFGKMFKEDDNRVHSITVNDEQLKNEKDRIVKIWKTKPFPAW